MVDALGIDVYKRVHGGVRHRRDGRRICRHRQCAGGLDSRPTWARRSWCRRLWSSSSAASAPFAGAVLGGLITGEIISLTSMFNPGYSYVMLFVAMTLVLVLRPHGLLGTAGRE